MSWAIAVVVMSIVTLAYQLKVQKEVFRSGADLVEENSPSADAREPVLTAVPMVLLAIGCVALSLSVDSWSETCSATRGTLVALWRPRELE